MAWTWCYESRNCDRQLLVLSASAFWSQYRKHESSLPYIFGLSASRLWVSVLGGCRVFACRYKLRCQRSEGSFVGLSKAEHSRHDFYRRLEVRLSVPDPSQIKPVLSATDPLAHDLEEARLFQQASLAMRYWWLATFMVRHREGTRP